MCASWGVEVSAREKGRGVRRAIEGEDWKKGMETKKKIFGLG